MEGRKNTDLLHETRKLLNVLNDENADLKSQNQRLEEELQQAHATKIKLESDMKKVNLNLMDQLHKRTSACKELEKQLHSLQQETDKESRRSTDSLTRLAGLEAENALLKENIKVLHGQCSSLEQQLAMAEEAVGRSSQQLVKATDNFRSEYDREQRALQEKGSTLEATVRSLQQQLAAVSAEKGSIENTFNDLHEEHIALQRAFDTEIAAVKSQNRKTAATEADVKYLHGQLLDTKTETAELLNSLRLYMQPLSDECDRNGEELQRLHSHVQGLTHSLQALRMADDNVISALNEKLFSQQQQINEHQSSLQHRNEEYKALEQHAQKLNAQLLRYKNEIGNLTTVFAELQESVGQSQTEVNEYTALLAAKERAIEGFKEGILKEQRLNTEMRLELENTKIMLTREETSRQIAEVELAKERSHSATQVGHMEQRLQDANNLIKEENRRTAEMRARYEDEIVFLRSQVDEHAATLTSALGKLRSSSSANHLHHIPPVDSRATSVGSISRPRSEVAMRPSLLAATYRLGAEEESSAIMFPTEY